LEERHLIVFSPYLPPSGLAVAQRLHHFIEEMEESGYHLKILSGKRSDWGQSLFFDLPSTPVNVYFRTLRELFCGIELGIRVALLKQPCLFLTTPPFLTTLIGAWAAHLSKKYYILDVRDDILDVFLRQFRIKPNSPIEIQIRKLGQWLFEHAAVIFTATQGVRENTIRRYPIMAERTFCVWNGYDANHFAPSAEKFERFTCVFHGNTGPLQDIRLARKVAAELKAAGAPIDIIVSGPGPQTALVKGANLENFKHSGPLDAKETAKLVANSHLGLSLRANHLSGEQAFAQPVFDCLGAGLPVITCPQSEAGIFLEEKNCGVSIQKKDAKIIAEKIIELSQNQDLYTSFSTNAVKVREAISRQKLRHIIIEVLNQL